jgi:tricorn protease-like protein
MITRLTVIWLMDVAAQIMRWVIKNGEEFIIGMERGSNSKWSAYIRCGNVAVNNVRLCVDVDGQIDWKKITPKN